MTYKLISCYTYNYIAIITYLFVTTICSYNIKVIHWPITCRMFHFLTWTMVQDINCYNITLSTLANRSRQFPTAMSMVSPNILYLCCEYAITCVFPPLTYNTTGFVAPVIKRPISMSSTTVKKRLVTQENGTFINSINNLGVDILQQEYNICTYTIIIN